MYLNISFMGRGSIWFLTLHISILVKSKHNKDDFIHLLAVLLANYCTLLFFIKCIYVLCNFVKALKKALWFFRFEKIAFLDKERLLLGKDKTSELLQSTVCYIFNPVYNSRYVKSWVWGKQVFYAESRNAAWHFRFPLLREIFTVSWNIHRWRRGSSDNFDYKKIFNPLKFKKMNELKLSW